MCIGKGPIDPIWFLKVSIGLLFTRKIKVGFGPITSGEADLSVRKWRIDPIINEINRTSKKYRAGFFIRHSGMKRFDYVVIVKRFNLDTVSTMGEYKRGRWFYDVVDNPNDEINFRIYFLNCPQFLEKIDHFIISTPVHHMQLNLAGKQSLLIEHPIINVSYKTDYSEKSEIKILAQGYAENLTNLKEIEAILPNISSQLGRPIRLYYHSNVKVAESEFVRWVRWDVKSSFSFMNLCDIAINIRNTHQLHQYTKPSTKPIAYMAAGLPFICKPGPADQLVIRHKVTGFFAFTPGDWVYWITKLASSSRLRKQIGTAARKSVEKKFAVSTITQKYLSIFDQV